MKSTMLVMLLAVYLAGCAAMPPTLLQAASAAGLPTLPQALPYPVATALPPCQDPATCEELRRALAAGEARR